MKPIEKTKNGFGGGLDRCVSVVILGILAAMATVSFGQATFDLPIAIVAAATGTATVAVGDVAGSSAPDVVFGLSPAGLVVIAENQGTGFTLLPPISIAGAASDIVVSDLDQDGDADIAVLTTSQVSVLLRNGATFSRTDYSAGTSTVVRLDAIDMEGDGDIDLLRGTFALVNSGAAVFVGLSTLPSASPASASAVFGDFDGDGDVDLARASISSGQLSIAFHAGGSVPTFSSSPILTTASGYSNAMVEAGDMNGDGIDDLVVHAIVSGRSSIVVCSGQTTGEFLPSAPVSVCYSATFLTRPALADFDDDGDLDVMAGDALFSILGPTAAPRIWLNDGQGNLPIAMAQSILARDGRDCVDLDQDGLIDVVSIAGGAQALFFRNRGLLSPTATNGSLSVLSGQNQTIEFDAPAAMPVVCRLIDGQGAPIAGAFVEWRTVSGGVSVASPPCAVSDPYGYVSAVVAPTIPFGPSVIEVRTSDAIVLSIGITVAPPQINVVSGDGQMATQGAIFPQTITVEARRSSTNAVLPNTPILFSLGMGLAFPGSSATTSIVMTDAFGRAGVGVAALPTSVTTPSTVSATILVGNQAVGSSTTAALTIIGLPALQRTSPESWVGDYDDPPPTLAVRLVDPFGVPLAGVPIVLAVSPAGYLGISPSGPYVTDVAGRVVVTPTVLPITAGAVTVTIGAPSLSAQTTFSLFVRRLRFIHVGGPQALLTYLHGSGPQPLILTIDQPLPPPGFVMSPYGKLGTSILSPGPALFVVDPQGTFGIADPGLIANPNLSMIIPIAPQLVGLTFALQILGFDAAAFPNIGQAIFLSNIETATL